MSISDALIIGLLGMAVVFAVLIILMYFVKLMSAALTPRHARIVPALSTAEHTAINTTAVGSCGEIRLRNVPEGTAAMIMAIVADELDVPLNELHFISISAMDDTTKGGSEHEV